MDRAKQSRLEAAGWTIGSLADFLRLSDEELAIIELRLLLVDNVQRRRKCRSLPGERQPNSQRSGGDRSRNPKPFVGSAICT